MQEAFHKLSSKISEITGTSWAFMVALGTILVWGISGPLFKFSDTWQLVINTGTTIITFLMVFLIQNTQNRDSKAIHLKLDELIRAMEGARNSLVDLEDCSDEELSQLQAAFRRLKEREGSPIASYVEDIEEDVSEELDGRKKERSNGALGSKKAV